MRVKFFDHHFVKCRLGRKYLITGALSLCFVTSDLQLTADVKYPPLRNRVSGDISNARRVALRNNQEPRAHEQDDIGEVDDSLPMKGLSLSLGMTEAQHAALRQLLVEQQTPSSPNFHRWLSPEEYADRFGVSSSDAQRIKSWLEREGFTSVEIGKARSRVYFEGTAQTVKNAFLSPIHTYRVDGRRHYANAAAPFIPAQLSGLVSSIHGLNDFHLHPHSARSRMHVVPSTPKFTSALSGNTFVAPGDFAVIYNVQSLYNAGIDGTGQKIAVAGQTDIDLKDIQAFRAASGLPANDPQVVLYGTSPGTKSDDLMEADLDVEWAGAVAKNATIIYVNSSDVFTSAFHAIDDNLAPVLSISYGTCEANVSSAGLSSLNAIFEQANAQGITVLSASGDAGAADCDTPTDNTQVIQSATKGLSVDIPSSLPSVTGIGGTTFSEGTGTYWNIANDVTGTSALSYIPERAWNDTSTTKGLDATGGGVSKFFTKPVWQKGTNVPADGFRDTPDVSLAASANHDGYLICTGGGCVTGFRNTDNSLDVVGGTSVGAPTFAGIIALLNQQTGTSQGNINTVLYPLAAQSTDAFHDITQGDNIVPCTAGTPDCAAGGTLGYAAGPGYDQATGLGSVDAANMVNEWTHVTPNAGSTGPVDFSLNLAPTSASLRSGGSATITATIVPLNAFAGTVNFSCQVATTLGNVTCAAGKSVIASGTSTLTITAPATSSTVPLLWRGSSPAWPLFLIGLTALLGSFVLIRGTARKPRTIALAGILLGAVLITGSCDDGDSERTGSVTVTAASGSVQHSATVSVTVD